MTKSHRSMTERIADRRSRRLINKAIAEAPSQTMRNELLVCVITSDAFSPAMHALWRQHAFFICTSRLFGLDSVLW